jgi:Fe(II)/alpha-ketoglutarate-dependent arginine beta-hydroxylase
MDQLELNHAERGVIAELLDELSGEYKSAEFDRFLDLAPVVAHELPERLRLAVNDFRLGQRAGTLTITGCLVDDERIGPTPSHWRATADPSPTLREEMLLVLLGSLLGDPFGWATQQDGKLIHDVVPIRGHEHEQLGSSSAELLTWHTEDAFHPLRADFLLFACLRNPYDAATTIGAIDDLGFSEGVRAILFEERFCILPDESHRPHNNSGDGEVDFTGIEKMRDDPDVISVLFGDRDRPYVRADPYFMSVADGDDEAAAALDAFVQLMDERMYDVALGSGDYLLLDNFRVVHGRKPFAARHDGSDRWLKRINVTRDLRKSRAARSCLSSRNVM